MNTVIQSDSYIISMIDGTKIALNNMRNFESSSKSLLLCLEIFIIETMQLIQFTTSNIPKPILIFKTGKYCYVQSAPNPSVTHHFRGGF